MRLAMRALAPAAGPEWNINVMSKARAHRLMGGSMFWTTLRKLHHRG